MHPQHQWWSVLVAAVLGGLMGVTKVAAGAQFLPVLSIREGATRSVQIPRADGYIAYLTLLNERDGGINGVPLVWEECETVFDVTRTLECYERLKAKGPTGAAVFHPMGTPPTYALLERAAQDRIPLLTVGYGRADAADGWVFPYVFNPPTTFWSQSTAKIRFIGQRVGGIAQLKGLKIVHVYHDSEFGRETIPLLDAQAAQYGFAVQHLAVPLPGLDHLTLTAAALKALGAEGLFPSISLSCHDHEGGGSMKFQRWDGTRWTVLTDWIAPDQALVRPLVEASAAKYAQEKGITPRDCP